MQLKLRQIILFLVACLVLILTNMSGGALLAVAVLLQLSLLVQEIPFTKKSQLAMFKIFLFSVPLFFLWAGAQSFFNIYLKEQSYFVACLAGCLTLSLTLLVAFQTIFATQFLQSNDFVATAALQNAFNEIRNKKNQLFKTTGLIFVFSFVPWLTEDWKLVFALTATLFYLNQKSLKTAISNP